MVLAPIARRARAPETWFCVVTAGAASSILIVSSFGRLNLGLRHVLPVLPLLAIAAATAFTAIWQRAQLETQTPVAMVSEIRLYHLP